MITFFQKSSLPHKLGQGRARYILCRRILISHSMLTPNFAIVSLLFFFLNKEVSLLLSVVTQNSWSVYSIIFLLLSLWFASRCKLSFKRNLILMAIQNILETMWFAALQVNCSYIFPYRISNSTRSNL